MKYEVVVADTTSSLDEQVNNMIKLGFVPQGGASVSKSVYGANISYVFAQAMIKNND
jgi:hypothetical protein